MKNILAAIFFIILFSDAFGTVIEKPNYAKRDNELIDIIKIELNDSNTVVYMLYGDTNNIVSVKPSFFIKDISSDKEYKLIRAEGITIEPLKKHLDFKGQIFSFKLVFPSISKETTTIDIIECANKKSTNFYGVQISEDNSIGNKFRQDYNYISIHDNKTNEWSEWERENNTFVVNVNNNGDIIHYKSNGEEVLYRKLSSVENGDIDGEHYQIIHALDESGTKFIFQFFDNETIGLKMIYGDFLIQFSSH